MADIKSKFGIRSMFCYIRVFCVHYILCDVCNYEGTTAEVAFFHIDNNAWY